MAAILSHIRPVSHLAETQAANVMGGPRG